MAKLTLEIVQRKFPEVRESRGKNGLEFNVHCPIGGHEKGGIYKLYINAETGVYFCQDCKAWGNAWDKFFNEILANRFGHLRLLRERDVEERSYGGTPFIAADGMSERWGKRKILAPGKTIELADLGTQHPAYQYLVRRNMIPDEFANKAHPFKALYCTKGQVEVLQGRCKSEARIVYPVTYKGDPIGWTARLIDKLSDDGKRRWVWNGRDWDETLRVSKNRWSDFEIPKWFHLPSMSKGSILYNFDEAKRFPFVVLAEGPFDIHKVGLFGAGYFGELPSEAQRRIIKNTWEDVFWMHDSGVNRNSGAFKNCLADLEETCNVRLVDLDGFDDPGDAPREHNLGLIDRILANEAE